MQAFILFLEKHYDRLANFGSPLSPQPKTINNKSVMESKIYKIITLFTHNILPLYGQFTGILHSSANVVLTKKHLKVYPSIFM